VITKLGGALRNKLYEERLQAEHLTTPQDRHTAEQSAKKTHYCVISDFIAMHCDRR